MEIVINYWAVVLAALASMMIGAVWYMPALFGKLRKTFSGVGTNKKMSARESVVAHSLTFIASFLTAYVLAHVTFLSNYFFHHSFLQDALGAALWLWLGFTFARFTVHDVFEGRRKKLTLINIGYELLTVIVMGLIIGLMGV